MRLFPLRLGVPRPDSHVGVVVITGSCCIPGMAPLDEQARRVVEQAIAETGVAAQVQVMPATRAYFGGAPRAVVARLISLVQAGQLGLPAVLINGQAVSYGVPDVETIKSALQQTTGGVTGHEEEDIHG